jgi:hypothetical protein
MTHPSVQAEPWLTKSELAHKLRISTRTIERLRIKPDMQVGGQNRYRLSSAEAQLHGVPEGGGNVIPFPDRRERAA